MAALAVGIGLVGVVAPGISEADAAPTAWADGAISTVLANGIIPGVKTQAAFMPAAPLDGTTLNAFATGLFPARRFAASRSVVNPATQTIGSLDQTFVIGAGLSGAVANAIRGVRAAGYVTVRGAGMEAAARMLQLRYSFPSSEDAFEKTSHEAASRADAAYSAAVVLDWGGWEPQSAKTTLSMLAHIPATTGERHAIVTRALSRLGMPYVWGGEADVAEGDSFPFGPQAHGGYDCSGFVWRVVALVAAAPSGALGRIGGRTTFEMAQSTPVASRLAYSQLQPGDLLLFGDNGPASTYDEIGHVGIYLGNNLMIHSSSQGVMISEVDTGWYKERFAFGKSVVPPAGVTARPLASSASLASEVPAGVDPAAGQDDVAP
jgi:cell wall-associated NlpC family hydrolase